VLNLVAIALLAAALPRLDDLPPPPPEPSAEGPILPFVDALAAAKENSPDLAVTRERVVQAQINLSRAWDQIKPTLTAGASYTRNSPQPDLFLSDGGTVASEVNNVQGNVTFAVPLFNGRVFPALRTAEQLIDIARLTATQLRRELLLNVAAAYLTGAGLRELWAVSVRQTRTTREHAAQAAARYEAGTLHRSAALRARIDVLRADEEARRAQLQYSQFKSQVAALIARGDTAFELAEPRQTLPEVRGAYEELLRRAKVERPELAIAKANEQIAGRLKDDAWLQFVPTLGLNAAVRYNNAAFNDKTVTWAVTLGLTVPLYDGGLRYAALREADSKLREARAQTRGETTRVEDEIRRAHLEVEGAKALLAEAQQQVELARETESLVRAQFEAGTASQVEVSDVVTALLLAESSVVRERLGLQLAALRLARAVGGFDP
jgi:outer membrane protein TolC